MFRDIFHKLKIFFCDDDVEKIYIRDSTVIRNNEIHKMYDEILDELGDLATVVSRNYVYGRIKDRTGLEKLTVETRHELEYLQSVQTFIDMTLDENALAQVKEELMISGYIKGRYGKKGDKHTSKSKPYHLMVFIYMSARIICRMMN